MRSDFRCSEDKEFLFEVIADKLISMEVILFQILALVSLIVFSNVVSGSNFPVSNLLFILSGSKLLSKDLIADRFMTEEAILFR